MAKADRVKVNVDAASHVNGLDTELALVVHDDHGRFLAAKTGKIRGLFSPSVVEALAIKETLSRIQGKGWQNVICENNSLVVVQEIVGNGNLYFTSFGAVVEDIRMLRNQFQGNYRVDAVPRQANMVAHKLTQATRVDDFVDEWLYNPPNIVRDILLADFI